MPPIVVVPFHQDEPLPAGSLPVPDGDHLVVAPTLPRADLWTRLVALHEAVATAVAEHPGATVVSGDCLVALGVLAGVQRGGLDPSLVWFDAHGDVHTLETSTSGYLGGLALRLALGAHAEKLAGLGLRPLAEHQATLVDARDLDPAEVDYLAGAELTRVRVEEVSAPAGPVVLHVDLDVIDPADLPGMRFPAPGGPSRADVLAAVRRIVGSGHAAAVSVACPWHPADDPRRAEVLAAMSSAAAAGPTS